MAEDAPRSRLGRGLAALIGDVDPGAAGSGSAASAERVRGTRKVPIEFLRPNPRNPRRTFAEAELDELAASIAARGLIQPIAVRPVKGASESYEIIAGERRWRASQRAGLHDVPVVVLDVTDSQALELAIIENVQRADLDPLEEAMGYQALLDSFSYAQEDVAKTVGKSRSHVANTLRLLKLPEGVKTLLSAGKLTAGHARMLVGEPDAEKLANEIVARGLNVRQVEDLVRKDGDGPRPGPKPKAPPKPKDANTRALEKRLSDTLGLRVTIDHEGEAGTMHIRYADLDQLDEVLRRLEAV
ncbi:Chromosome (plasmid) partitioning protein ParB / Stage 0 sporulation protein J [Rhodovulum sp. PH10]|uniref:ParB/RepB/Spo0J family partition protein n=1 Tax=Rhodovulum sp. PH10 TaxID=1187851 RepID=UPI00027C248A|nr:ParB/RepB/Spo0J family partition protein [Rhodovulum sp. PH10]EJW13064.1 Chromosome (plasmid) partitioning protein ParB / Stage 0 sporulation protein J [Rhodovulum sp. PH10]